MSSAGRGLRQEAKKGKRNKGNGAMAPGRFGQRLTVAHQNRRYEGEEASNALQSHRS